MTTELPCNVNGILEKPYGKYPDEEHYAIIMEFEPLTEYLAENLPASLNDNESFKTWLNSRNDGPAYNTMLYNYADQVMVLLPSPRFEAFKESDFNKIKNNVLNYTDQVVEKFGFYTVNTGMPLLDNMEDLSQAILFIGLIFSVVNIIFIILSSLLIYSLLMITVETKDFENGILRLVGVSKLSYSGMILYQAVLFVVPSIFFGFAFSPLGLWLIYSQMFTEDMGFTPTYAPDGWSSVQALLIGLLIPFLSAIVPIKKALRKQLVDSLNYQRAKTTGVKVSIVNTAATDLLPLVLSGLLMSTYGIILYYFVPLSFLSGKTGLLLIVFFIILLGMLFGLSLLTYQLQGLL